MEQAKANTDREIYHTPFGGVHDDSIHVTEGGSIGINVAGRVIVKPLREWHALAVRSERTFTFPLGWKLVPIEPTEEMLKAIETGGMAPPNVGDDAGWRVWAKADWEHTLKHVPEPPAAVTEIASANHADLVVRLRTMYDDMTQDCEPRPMNWPATIKEAADALERKP